jgi:hypothetical protein
MGLATNKQWKRPLSGFEIDGEDLWDAITNNNTEKARKEMVFYVDDDTAVIQHKNYRFIYGFDEMETTTPVYYFDEDKDPSLSYEKCSDPSLMYSSTSAALAQASLSTISKLSLLYSDTFGRASSSTAIVGIVIVSGVLAVALVSIRNFGSPSTSRYSSLP